MQTYTKADGTVVGVGSVNHAELARLQAAAKKGKTAAKAKDDEFEDEIEDDPKPKPEPKVAAKPTS